MKRTFFIALGRKAVLLIVVFAILEIAAPSPVSAQATVFAEGLTRPSGIYVDDAGFLWVASQGTGDGDAGVDIVTPEGVVYPFIKGLPSTMVQGEPSGTHHAYFNNDVELIIVQGEGTGEVSESILVVDTTGFTPGDPALGPADIDAVFNVGDFVDGELGEGSNPFAMTFVPNSGIVYLSDAKANAIVRGEDGVLSILTQLPDVPNTGSQGPPMVDAVPTGIDYDDGRIFVGTLTGFPFNGGAASIFEIDPEGNVTTLIEDRTTVVDLQVIPGGGGILFLEHRFAPNAGVLYKYNDGEVTELAAGLDRPTGLRLGLNGEVYVSLLEEGQIVKVEGVVTSAERELPEGGRPIQVETYPNPFTRTVTIAVNAPVRGETRLQIADLLGRTVYAETDMRAGSGTGRLHWNGKNAQGYDLPPGPYFYRVELGGRFAEGVMLKH